MLTTPRLAIHTAPAHDYAGTDDTNISLVHLLQAATRLTSNPWGVAEDVPCCPSGGGLRSRNALVGDTESEEAEDCHPARRAVR